MLDSGRCHLETYVPVMYTAYVTGAYIFEHPMSVQWYFMYPVSRELLTSQSQLLVKIPPILAILVKQYASDLNDLAYVTGA